MDTIINKLLKENPIAHQPKRDEATASKFTEMENKLERQLADAEGLLLDPTTTREAREIVIDGLKIMQKILPRSFETRISQLIALAPANPQTIAPNHK
jgi:hypothetical protein